MKKINEFNVLRTETINLLLKKSKNIFSSKNEEEIKVFALLFSYAYSTLKHFIDFVKFTSAEVDTLYLALQQINLSIVNNDMNFSKFKAAITIYRTFIDKTCYF